MSAARSPLELLQAAAERHGAGDLPAAEMLYRAALHREAHPVGQHLLGALLHQTGRFDEAVIFLSQAAAKLPNDGELLGNYGAALVSGNRPAEALPILDRALSNAPPSPAAVLINRSAAHRALGSFEAALEDANQALALQPRLAGAYVNAGSALQSLGRRIEALDCFLRGLEIAPNDPGLETNVGAMLFLLGRPKEARPHLERAIASDPSLPDAHQNLGAVLADGGDIAGADASYERALALNPNHSGALGNLGVLDLLRGRVDVALARFESALASDPANREAASNSLMALNYLPALPPDSVFDLHRGWGASLAQPMRSFPPRTPGERIRVGFLSPDLWNHPVASFLEPLLRSIDPTGFALHIYNDRNVDDSVTARLRALPAAWNDVAGWRGDQLTAKIRSDRIDILVDLAGHTAQNRLIDLADRAAPVQMTMIGYPNTTGLPTMDYRVSDAIADPLDVADRWHTEALIRVPGGFLCWRPPDSAPDPTIRTDRPFTFGSFNALAKLSSQTISTWAAILREAPGARLLLKAKALSDAETRNRIVRAFSAHRIAADRLALVSWLPATQDHLDLYADVDVALDPFPYNGTTTTVEALWMGAPVVSLIGDSHAGRVGASILTHVGLAEDLAADVGSYVERAINLAASADLRARRRFEQRAMLQASPLLDGDRYARAMEAAWRAALDSVG